MSTSTSPRPRRSRQPIEQKTTRVQPGYGRAGSIKTHKVVTAITDIDALFGLLKTHAELKAKMLELAQRRSTYRCPGEDRRTGTEMTPLEIHNRDAGKIVAASSSPL
jgi:hypothetical protein